jgi:hypothetical protein
MKTKSYISNDELKEKMAQDKKHKVKFLNQIDLGKKFPDYIDKRILRAGFIVVLLIQLVALTLTGFNFNPAWAECDTPICNNPFYGATGGICEQNINLCTTEILTKGEVIGTKPPLFALMANDLSWLCLIIAGFVNYKVCKKRRYIKKR